MAYSDSYTPPLQSDSFQSLTYGTSGGGGGAAYSAPATSTTSGGTTGSFDAFGNPIRPYYQNNPYSLGDIAVADNGDIFYVDKSGTWHYTNTTDPTTAAQTIATATGTEYGLILQDVTQAQQEANYRTYRSSEATWWMTPNSAFGNMTPLAYQQQTQQSQMAVDQMNALFLATPNAALGGLSPTAYQQQTQLTQMQLDQARATFLSTPLPELGGMTPTQFQNKVNVAQMPQDYTQAMYQGATFSPGVVPTQYSTAGGALAPNAASGTNIYATASSSLTAPPQAPAPYSPMTSPTGGATTGVSPTLATAASSPTATAAPTTSSQAWYTAPANTGTAPGSYTPPAIPNDMTNWQATQLERNLQIQKTFAALGEYTGVAAGPEGSYTGSNFYGQRTPLSSAQLLQSGSASPSDILQMQQDYATQQRQLGYMMRSAQSRNLQGYDPNQITSSVAGLR